MEEPGQFWTFWAGSYPERSRGKFKSSEKLYFLHYYNNFVKKKKKKKKGWKCDSVIIFNSILSFA